ncbi:MAG: PLP-dependent transferase [Treponema sp.]
MKLCGALIAFTGRGGLAAGRKLMKVAQFATLAVSFGDAETLMQHPASIIHSPYTPEESAVSDIVEGLVRLSV